MWGATEDEVEEGGTVLAQLSVIDLIPSTFLKFVMTQTLELRTQEMVPFSVKGSKPSVVQEVAVIIH